MSLTRVTLTAVRNLQPVSVFPSQRINILFGKNGSGKTSVLEAIHLLGLGRSFRSSRLQTIINYEQQAFTVFGQVEFEDGRKSDLGVSRDRQGELLIRIDGQNARSAVQLADTLPLQLINPDSFLLLEGSPKFRRHFLDWGVFHVEHRFLSAWKRFQSALKQRNSWLRHGILDRVSQAVWDRELCLASDEIDGYRRSYIQQLKPVFERVLSGLLDIDGLTLSYYRGWDKERSLEEVLVTSIARDQQLGHTYSGPQRADLRLRLGGHNATDALSRGQQKLVVCALRIAQGYLVDQSKRGQCIYLVDDLPSELDGQSRQALCRLLEDLNCQVFITCVDHELLRDGWKSDTPISMFHVEHGRITNVKDHSE